MTELFVVQFENGELIDISGDGGFSVFASRSEAQYAMDSAELSIDGPQLPLEIVRFVRISK